METAELNLLRSEAILMRDSSSTAEAEGFFCKAV